MQSRLTAFSDENLSGKTLPHRSSKRYAPTAPGLRSRHVVVRELACVATTTVGFLTHASLVQLQAHLQRPLHPVASVNEARRWLWPHSRPAKTTRVRRRVSDASPTADLAVETNVVVGLTCHVLHRNNQRAHTSNNRDTQSSSAPGGSSGSSQGPTATPKDAVPISGASSSFSMLLKSELLGISHRHDYVNYAEYSRSYSSMGSGSASSTMHTGNGCGIYNYSTSGANPGAFGSSGSRTGFAGLGASSVSSNILRFKAPRRSLHDEAKTRTPFHGIGCSSQRYNDGLLTLGSPLCFTLPSTVSERAVTNEWCSQTTGERHERVQAQDLQDTVQDP